MARFDVYSHPSGKGYLLDVQADFLDDLKTRVVVPLLPPQKTILRTLRLNPVFVIDGQDHVMITQALAAVQLTMLRNRAANLSQHTDEIRDALDFLLIGF